MSRPKVMTATEVEAAIVAQRLKHRERPESLPPCECTHPYHKGKECPVAVNGYFCRCDQYAEKGAQ